MPYLTAISQTEMLETKSSFWFSPIVRGCLKSRRRYKTFMLTFGAYSESWQYKSWILLIQAEIHSPVLSDDNSLTSQTFVPPPSVLVTRQTSFVPPVEARLEEPNATHPSPTSKMDCQNIRHPPTLKIDDDRRSVVDHRSVLGSSLLPVSRLVFPLLVRANWLLLLKHA